MAETHLSPEERELLVEECLPHVKRVAYRLAARLPSHLDIRDLVQAGLVGLLDAMERYEDARGVRFWSFAETRVRGAMLDSLRNLDPVPRSVRRRRREIEQAYGRLQGRLGRAATDQELAREVGVGLAEIEKILEDVRGTEIGLSLADGTDDLIQFVADDNSVDPFVVIEKQEMQTHLANGLEEIPERDRLLLALYYTEELTMKEIGKVLNVNESRVSQLHSRAVLRLRGVLANRLQITAPPKRQKRQARRKEPVPSVAIPALRRQGSRLGNK